MLGSLGLRGGSGSNGNPPHRSVRVAIIYSKPRLFQVWLARLHKVLRSGVCKHAQTDTPPVCPRVLIAVNSLLY